MSDGQSGRCAPLHGVRVVDLADESAVFASRVLADLGADVIRVEPPDGGRVRTRAPFLDDTPGVERSYTHLFCNAGKRSAVIEDDEVLCALAASADILIETPALWAGEDSRAAAVHRIHPSLVIATVTPFGLDTEWSHRKGSDLTAAASGGLLAITGEHDGPPVHVAGRQPYTLASLAAATGALIALFGRGASAEPVHLDISIQRCVLLAVMQTANANLPAWRGIVPGRRIGWDLPVIECADGLWISARPRPDRWELLHAWAVELGIEPEFGPDERLAAFALPPGAVFRTGHAADVVEAIATRMARAEFLRRAWDDDSVVCLPVQTMDEVARCEQFIATGSFKQLPHEPLGAVLGFPRSPVAGADGAAVARRAPLLGEHTEQVLAELGLEVGA